MTDTQVNQQIVDAVETATEYAFGFTEFDATSDWTKRLSAGGAVAYDKAAQSAALAFQDAVDYQRNILAVSTAAQGKALAAAFVAPDVPTTLKFLGIYLAAMLGPLAAEMTAGMIETTSGKSLASFPRG